MTFLAMLQQGARTQICHANSDDWSGGVRHAHAFTYIARIHTHRKEVFIGARARVLRPRLLSVEFKEFLDVWYESQHTHNETASLCVG